MTAFEHLMTLGSFVLALGVASILNFAAMLIHRRDTVRASPAHIVWVLSIFLAQISFWIGSYLFRNDPRADLVGIAYVIIAPILLYLQGAVAVADWNVDNLKAQDERNRRLYLALMALTVAVDAVFFMVITNSRADIPGGIGWDPATSLISNAILLACPIAALLVRNGAVRLTAALICLTIRFLFLLAASVPMMVT